MQRVPASGEAPPTPYTLQLCILSEVLLTRVLCRGKAEDGPHSGTDRLCTSTCAPGKTLKCHSPCWGRSPHWRQWPHLVNYSCAPCLLSSFP